jgi:ion channel-forming bestrophin family protein
MIISGKLPINNVVRELRWQLLSIMGVTAGVVILHNQLKGNWIVGSSTPLTIIGAALSLFLAFRNNVVWDRYWEARNLWGRLVNASRTFLRQCVTFIGAGTEENSDLAERLEQRAFVREMALWLIAYVHAFRCHLREDDPISSIESYLGQEETTWLRTKRNVPAAILLRMGQRLRAAQARGWINRPLA